ncbi:MAG: DUF5693 family protein [Anaerovorax sp.]
MKKIVKSNLVLLVVVAIGLVAAFSAIGGRFIVEKNNDTYDIVLDYNELEEMAGQSTHDVSWWLEKFKDMGITKVGLAEESFVTLVDNKDVPVSATVMDVVMKKAGWEKDYDAGFIEGLKKHGFDKHDLLVEAASKDSFDFIKNAVVDRYQPKQYYFQETLTGGCLVLNGTAKETLYTEKYKYLNSMKKGFVEKDEIASSKLEYLNLGMMESKVKLIQDAGMEIMPRTASYEDWNDTKYAKAVIASYEKYGIVPEYMIVGGECVIGYDDGIKTAENYIQKNGITIGMIENTTQLQNILQMGVNGIVKNNQYDAVRIFSVWDYIQNRYQYYGYKGAEEIENMLFRAITERNVRLIYFKPIKEFKDQHVYVTDVKEYQQMFENLDVRLAEHGIHFGDASVMTPYHASATLSKALILFACMMGCLAAGILLLKSILPVNRKLEIVIACVGVLGIIGLFLLAPSHLALIASFSAAVLFPCLAIVFITKQSKDCSQNLAPEEGMGKVIGFCAGTLIVGVLISLLGGMMTAAPISTINFMLEIDIFRGVKLAQLLPIAFFIVAYLAYYGFGKNKKKAGTLEFQDLRDLLNTSLKIWMIIIGVIVLGVGYYYIMRTGHESGVEVSSVEMIFRNTLEDHLLARPRNKEFMFAFPAVMLMVYTSVRRFKLWPVIFGLASVIGMTSVVNTFMHIRTPLYLGFVRTGYSLLFGLIVGIVGICIFELIHRLYKKVEGRLN